MSTLAPDASVMEIEDELIVYQTMLESLGDGDDTTRAQLERTIYELEERLTRLHEDETNEEEEDVDGQDVGVDNGARRGSVDSDSNNFLLPDVPGAYPTGDQNYSFQTSFQNGGYQSGYQNGGNQNAAYQNATHQNGYEGGNMLNGYQNANNQNGYQNANNQNRYQTGNNQNGYSGNSQFYMNQLQPTAFKRPFEPSSPNANDPPVKRLTPNPSRSQTPFTGSQMQSTQDRREAMIEKQRQAAEAAQRRRESEKADAELAARLYAHNSSSPIAGPSRPVQDNNILSRNDTSPSQWAPVFRPQTYKREQQQPSPSPFAALRNESGTPSYVSAGHSASQQYQSNGLSTNGHNANVYPSNAYSANPYSTNAYSANPYSGNLFSANPYSASPSHHQVKSETSRPNLLLPGRSSGHANVVDLTASDDDDDDDVVELLPTRPSYPMPGQMNNSSAHDRMMAEQLAWGKKEREEAERRTTEERRAKIRQELQIAYQKQRMAGYNPMGVASSSSTASSLSTQQAMLDRLRAQSHGTKRSHDDLSQLSHLVRGRGLHSDDGNFAPPSWPTYNGRDDAVVDPEATREELRKLMENIEPDEEDTTEVEQDVPINGMTVKLKPYQMTGLKWLQKMETGNNKGGILADDMGLGKTVQAIALMVTRRSEDPMNKTTLIVAPVALLRQWSEEVANKIKPGSHRLTTFLHHGSKKKNTHRALREYDVVLTTFGTLAAEGKKLDAFNMRKAADPQATPRDDEKCLFIGPNCNWYRIIIDEAQCIKNRNTRTAKAAFQLNARSRFCLTGTPMMNGVDELYSLVHFIGVKPYSDWNKFNYDFVRPLKSPSDAHRENAMKKFQALLKATLLRRNKQTKVNGRPILILPERVIEQTHAVFSKDEREYYDALEGKQQIQFNKYLKAGTVGRSYAHILLLLLRLRQACCHPHLIKDFGVAAAADISADRMVDLCKTLSEDVVRRIKEADGSFECPVCFDAVENPAIFVPCGHKTCTECFTRIADPTQGVANGDENGGLTSKCPECRNPINTKSVVDYDCFKKIHMGATDEEAEQPVAAVDDEDEETDSDMSTDSYDSDDDSDNGDGTLGGFIVRDGVDSQASTASEGDSDSEDKDKKDIVKMKKEQAAQNKAKAKAERKKVKAKQSAKAKGKQKMKKSNYSLAELKKLAGTSKKHKKIYMNKVRKDYLPSAKIEKTMEIVKDIVDGVEGEKIIIFSQWTSLLDLLEIDIDGRHYGYRRYDGSMNAKQRGDAVEDFKTKPNIRMMLVSLKAGNAGLNLNIASQVIILDPFWNPYIEEQAIDRAHRLGQERPVKVHRILVEETVEDRILALQEKKRAVISEALDEKASKGVSRLSPQELAYLFGINRNVNDPLTVPRRNH